MNYIIIYMIAFPKLSIQKYFLEIRWLIKYMSPALTHQILSIKFHWTLELRKYHKNFYYKYSKKTS